MIIVSNKNLRMCASMFVSEMLMGYLKEEKRKI